MRSRDVMGLYMADKFAEERTTLSVGMEARLRNYRAPCGFPISKLFDGKLGKVSPIEDRLVVSITTIQ